MYANSNTFIPDYNTLPVASKRNVSLLSKIDGFVFSFGITVVVRLWTIGAIITVSYAISTAIIASVK